MPADKTQVAGRRGPLAHSLQSRAHPGRSKALRGAAASAAAPEARCRLRIGREKNASMASSESDTSIGVPNTVVVVKKDKTPPSVMS